MMTGNDATSADDQYRDRSLQVTLPPTAKNISLRPHETGMKPWDAQSCCGRLLFWNNDALTSWTEKLD
jgi:hypothetical protein